MVTSEPNGVMTSFSSDQALVDGLHAGDCDAFERLYGDYHPAIYNLCARILGDREEAQDLTQDVFIKAFSSPPVAVGGSVKLRPWLYRVATNTCFNHLRGRDKLGGDATIIDAARAPVDEYERTQTVALVEQSLGELNERYRTVLVLRDLHGLPAVEIAEVMAVSRPAADVLVHRARAAFKSAFSKLRGDTGAAPANLGLVLAPLSIPAALHALPPLPASFGPMPQPIMDVSPAPHAAPGVPAPHAVPLPDLSSSVGPASAGVLTKVGAALTTKIGITAAAATLAVGGGAAMYKAESEDDHRGGAAQWQQTSPSGDSHHASHEWSPHEARWGAAANWKGHGWPISGHAGQWDSHDGTRDSQDDGHTSDGRGGSSDHGSGGDGGSDTPATHDDPGDTRSPTHDGSGDTSGTHRSDSVE